MFLDEPVRSIAAAGRAAERAYKRLRSHIRRTLRRSPILGPALVRSWHRRRYRRQMRRSLRLHPPVGFNEHIIHRILHDRDPRLKIVCDKIAVRDFIRERVGAAFLIPLLGIWDDPDDIDWSALPDRFVLKPTYSSGDGALIRSEQDRNPASLTEQARGWLQRDYFDTALEWGYRDLPRRIMAEALLEGPDGQAPVEAHVLTFGGKVALIRVLTGPKLTPERRNGWYDIHGARLANFSGDVKPSDATLTREQVDDIVRAAERAAEGFDHIRVDFYLTDQGLKIGELTPYHGAGLTTWKSQEHDEVLGRVWRHPARIAEVSRLGATAPNTDAN